MSPTTRLRLPVNEKDHKEGPSNAPIVIVEYGDFQCPHCGRAYPVMKRLKKTLGDNLLFVYRHFPMAEAHPDAPNAARAAEAAGRQGRFWEMHSLLFENQNALDSDSLVGYAESLDLDMERWLLDMDSDEIEAKVEEDFKSGVRSGANGTPTFFVNGSRYDGDWAYEPFLEAISSGVTEA
ncbi:MAG: DsbA family protein [Fibrobacteres bacterium]|nr:DsbA family protein [Fibrobacterota bacterium]